MGHVISEKGIKANPKKVSAIKDYPRPLNVKQIQRFLGMCAYYRIYVPNFAKIAKPLTILLKKEQPFIWTDAQQTAFDELKRSLLEDVTLAFPDFSDGAIFYVTTDELLAYRILFRSRCTSPRQTYIFFLKNAQ